MAVFRNKIGEIEINQQFAEDVDKGLSSSPKRLSSKYFYDSIGDQIFIKIMGMPEYYLTNCEFEILSSQSNEIIDAFELDENPFKIIELGAGDGTKTIQILKNLRKFNFTYEPIDISSDAIQNLEARINSELPWVNIKGEQGEYFKILDSIEGKQRKIILFLGSNIGNLTDEQSSEFILRLSEVMNAGDMILIGVDKKKPKEIVLPAYNDAQGYSRDFNLNLLERINRELGGDFDKSKFKHVPEYDESEGIALSYLESTEDQIVQIQYLEKSFSFAKGEKMHTEISRKYDDEIIERIIMDSGLKIEKVFTDRKKYFSDYLLKKH